MIKHSLALVFALSLVACATPLPVVVDKNIYIAVALDDGFFDEDRCPKPPRPASSGANGEEIMDTEISRNMVETYTNNKICYNTIRAIEQKNREGIEKVNRMNSEETD